MVTFLKQNLRFRDRGYKSNTVGKSSLSGIFQYIIFCAYLLACKEENREYLLKV